MKDDPSRCLEAREILAFLDGDVAESRKVEIDRHLDECRLCEAAVEGVAGLEWREGFLKSTDSLVRKVRARTATAAAAGAVRRPPVSRLRPAPLYLTLAATLVVGASAAVILTRPGPGEALFRQNFEPYPSTRPVARGALDAGRSRALTLYEAGDCRGALAAFEEGLRREPSDPEARFYAGVCRLALGRPAEASRDLQEVLRLDAKEYQAPAEWYLALAHLRHRDPEEARPHLERIAGAGGFYRDRARALLSELDRLGRER
jgi:tetratricopeptide (TPR) repeat protein